MRRFLVIGLLALAAILSGCEQRAPVPKFRLTDVTGAPFGKALALNDHHGKPRTLQDFRGKVVVLFFGFMHCPDVCPATLAELAQVAKALGPDAARMQVLFVTVDPERDTPGLLRQYVPSFHPDFLGLHGDSAATAQAAKEFKIFYQKQLQSGGDYSMDHSAGTYILDQQGTLRLFAQHGAGASALLHDIRLLLQGA
ncbi:MAG: photosynthetic protein synthase [Burkholderiales bacterium]|nr:photosynthetic protein synthase [Burkholderiales bacterium]